MSEAEKTLTSHHRFELLDGLRGIGALFVAALHTPPTMQRYLPFLNSFLAVDLFFCLSGFVIAFSYEQRLRFGMPFRTFVLARLIRLYPLYLLGLLAGVVAILGRSYFMPAAGRPDAATLLSSFLLNLLMLPALLPRTVTTNAFPFDPPAWSLFFEVAINLLYARLILARRAGTVLLLLLAAASLAAMISFGMHLADFGMGWSADLRFLFGLPRVGYSFLLGVLLFRLFRARPEWRLPSRLHHVAAWAIVFATAFILGAPFHFTHPLTYQAALIGAVMPLLIFLAAGVTLPASWRRVCLVLGEISYPLYVLHLPLLAPLYLLQKFHLSGPLYQAVAPLSLIALSFLARYIALHYDAPVRGYLSARLLRPATHYATATSR